MSHESLISALLDLLLDDDPKTQGAVREKFRALGAAGFEALEAAEVGDNPLIRTRARHLAWQLRTDAVALDFEQLLGDPQPDLERAIILLSQLERPQLDPADVVSELDRLGERIASELVRRKDPRERALALGCVLHADEGFDGDVKQYYDPRNSYVDQVLERRLGIPISLSAIYILAGRRAGLSLVGVGFPMHFLVALEEDGEQVLIDPYRGGRIMTKEACRALLAGFHHVFREEYLSPVSDRRMLRRMLANLVHVYQGKGDSLRLGRLFRLVNILQASGR